MSATAAQIDANRAHALHSTGPRTDEGKAASSKNATRHGLTARGLIVLPGLEDDFTAHEAGLRESLRPWGELQEAIFMRALESSWNLRRCRLAEAKLYSTAADPSVDPLLDDQNEAKYTRIQKYAKQNENSLYKAMRHLAELQTENQYRHEAYPLTEEQITDADLYEQTPHAISEVCSYREVIAHLADQKDAEANIGKLEANRIIAKCLTAAPRQSRNFQFEPNLKDAGNQAAEEAAEEEDDELEDAA